MKTTVKLSIVVVIGFAFLSQTLYLAQDAGLDTAKSQQAMAVGATGANKAYCPSLISRLKRLRIRIED